MLNSGQEPACKVLKTLIVTWQDIGYGGGSGAAIVGMSLSFFLPSRSTLHSYLFSFNCTPFNLLIAENDFFYFPHIPTCFPSREVTAKGGNGELDCVPRHL